VVKLRHPGRYVTGAVMLALLAALGLSFRGARIDWAAVPRIFSSDVMLEGAWFTVKLTVCAQGGAILLGVVIAVMRISHNPVLKTAAWAFIWFFRGVPAFLQILIWYNLALIFQSIVIPVPFTGLYLLNQPTTTLMTAFVAALLGLGLNEAAYMAEIVRAGISSVDSGQMEAAGAIGLTPGQTLRRIVLPQALRVIIPPTGNDFINMLKATAIASVIGYSELVQGATSISSRNLQILEAYFAAAAWYMIVVTIASVAQYFVERLAAPSGSRASFRWNWKLRPGPGRRPEVTA
jgi:polar amino acid transport system permease protein